MESYIKNRKASFEYHFLRKEIAGLVLVGSEVKGIREGLVSFVDSFCYFRKGELFVKGINIDNPKYVISYRHDPSRERKLLMSKKELRKLEADLMDNKTIVPLSLFVNEKGIIKMEIALSIGKKNYDKRESIKAKDIEKQTKRELNQ